MTNRQLSYLGSLLVGLVLVILQSPRCWGECTRVVVMDVGQGDAILIDTPGEDWLIDGGPDRGVLEELGRHMQWWDRSLDGVLLTHPHADHLAGLIPVVERYDVGLLVDDGQGYGGDVFRAWQKIEGIPRETWAAGEMRELAPGVTFRTVWPQVPYGGISLDDPNDGSLVLVLEAYGHKMLLTGDAGVAEEAMYAEAVGDIDVLKVGHHASRTSSGDKLLAETTPEIAIISVGQDNEYGLPDEDVLARLQESGVETYRTDWDGAIELRFQKDGITLGRK